MVAAGSEPSTAVQEHRRHAPAKVKVAILTVSDTRTEADDEGGRILREALCGAGHEVVHQAIVKDEPRDVRERVEALLRDRAAEVVVTTGGTGVSARDTTYEALIGLMEKKLDGFGEIFRSLSFGQVGAAAMLSRAVAGTVAGGGVVIALPGSPDAVRLAVEKLIVPELGHLAKLARRPEKDSARAARASFESEPPPRAAAGLGQSPAERLADDLAAIAVRHPALEVPSTVMALYAAVRTEVEAERGEPALRHVPRFGAGARACYAELAIVAGQLAAAAHR
jgi:molybdenum cofactor biosynthesis protein B